MSKQLIISVGREFGCEGHKIAERLAERFNLPFYDSNLLEHIAEEKDFESEHLRKFDEKPKNRLFTRTVRGYSTSRSDNLAQMQFDFLKKKATAGESFVVVGRCSETILKEFDGMISIFVLGDKDKKAEHVMDKFGVSKEEALAIMKHEDWKRKSYHNYHCKGKWGDSRNYDFSINSSKLGVEKTTDIVEIYIKERIAL